MFRAAFPAPFSTAEVNTVTKTSSPQSSSAVPMMCEDGRPFLTDPATGRRLCACHLAPEGTHSHLHGGGGLSGGLKSLAVPPNSAAPPVLDGTGFYNPLLRGFPVRPTQCLTPSGPPITFDPTMAAHPYGLLYAGLDVNGLGMRKAATRETTGPLKAWLHEHRKNPYPTKAEKIMLAIITKMTLTQVSTWFANARRRLKKENRLYTGRDHDDHDDDGHGKDDDDNPDTEHFPEPCDSDEDINVDVSDVSDNEGTPSISGTALSSATPSSTTSPSTTKHSCHSSSSSSGLSPYPSSPPFPHRPSFIPRPGPIPDYPVGGLARIGAFHSLSNGLDHHHHHHQHQHHSSPPVVSRDSGVLAIPKISPLPVAHQHVPSSAGTGSSSSAATKPKIWSISEIIQSDSTTPSSGSTTVATAAVAAAAVVPSASSTTGNESARILNAATDNVLVNSRDVPASVQTLVLEQTHDFLKHRLVSSFSALDSPEVRLTPRHASAFLGVPVPVTHRGWGMTPSVGLSLGHPCHAVKPVNGSASGGECSPDAEGSTDDDVTCSPQTEALDLHTKKEDRGKSAACT